MFHALDKDNGIIDAVDAVKGEDYFCPYCSEKLILRQGKLIDWHFAHSSNSTCLETGEMCEWHLRMQSYFSPEYREVVVEHNGIKHRADILKDGYVIEFQHSPISYDDFNERNTFYISLGYKVIWIFDSVDWWESDRLIPLNDKDDNLFRFKYPLKILQQSEIDSKNVSICFCNFEDDVDYVFNIFWHRDNWNVVAMDSYRHSIILSDDTDLGHLFFSNYNWRDYYLRGTKTTKIYRGRIKGYPKKNYQCKHTKDWARDCEKCSCCRLIEENEKGHVYYCDNNRDYNINEDGDIPSVFIKMEED